MKYKQMYRKIVDELVRESFPELKDKKIIVVEFPRLLQTWSFAERGFKNYYVFINKGRRDAKLGSLKGQLAHELCHLVMDHMNKSFVRDFFHNFFKKIPSFFLNTSFSRKIETAVDRETIKRGYVKELLSMTEEWEKLFSNRTLKKLYARGYLTEKEIKSYAKEVKKR